MKSGPNWFAARAVDLHSFHCSGRDSPGRDPAAGIMPPPKFLMMQGHEIPP